MTEFFARESLRYSIPDDLTLAQFTLDAHHPARAVHPRGVPWLVEDGTGRKVDLEEIRARVSGLANGLSIQNIRDGDVICIFSPNHIDYPVAIWAIHRLGAVVSPANPSFTAEELHYQLVASDSRAIIAHPSALTTALEAAALAGIPANRVIVLEGRVDENDAREGIRCSDDLVALGLSQPPHFIERKLNPGEAKTKIAFLSFSSGTTGKPKAVAIPHIAPIANLLQMQAHYHNTDGSRPVAQRWHRPGDSTLACLPFFHIYGLLIVLHYSLFCGMTVVVVPKFEFVKFMDSIMKYKITHLYLVPPQVVLFCKHPAVPAYDFSHVRAMMAGAAPVPAELTEQLRKVLPNASIGQGYGMTETSTSIAMVPPDQHIGVHGSAGRLIPGCRARIVKEDGSLAQVGEVGELYITGPSMALRYANNAEATKETFIDGWVRTGDEVYINADGDLFVVDRLKEIMKVRGFQVAPAELEGHLLKHPDVADCCVVGIPDDYSGEVPLAFVMLSQEAAKRAASGSAASIKTDIAKWVSDHKVAYKKLAGGVEFVDSIPKNPSGKLLRRVLRDKAKAMRASRIRAKL
ncbi:amp dependent CoA ligase [Peniophora sp. CONT]|nr:amp dependent CoA ligase [Peniophora sp. CONT]